jgi:ATP-binding cassette subfamily B protein
VGTLLVFYIPPLVIAQLISQQSTVNLETAWQLLLLFGGAWLAGEMLWRLAIYLMIEFETAIIRKLYDDALKLLIEKELTFYANRFTGTITKNLLAYARRFETFFDTIIFEIVSNVIPAIFAAIILFFISPWLSIALFGMLTFGALMVIPLIRKRLSLVQQREDAHSKMAGHISDVVTNIAAIKSFGAEATEKSQHKQYVDDFITKAKRSWHYQNSKIDMVVSPIYVATNVLGLGIILSLGVDPATKAALFIGFNYYATVTRFMWSFNSVYRRLEESITDAAQFVEYTLDAPKVVDQKDAKVLRITDGNIKFADVAFTHDDNSGVLFNHFNLEVKPGQKVGLVGHSGAGKSTISNLLLRFMNVDEGAIFIDNQDINTVTQQSLHTSIAFVPQEPLLFHRSLRENIAYGKPHASESEILSAAKKAHALEFIEKLPDGFNTLVGERGVKLSGGQRQRIAIARAILKDAPILVLDEATSALDSESEKLIQASLETLMKGRTSIVIAHRLSTIAKLDRIVVLENGRIIEDGSHAELLKHGGVYAKLWNHQSGGFIEE